ncbi:hypothetical protein EI94DRAFT_1702547 [Lactarius quietus]|nr:hypothetical protein EI94DRAFT_1702547 [Lactarius quietus]
MVNWSSCQAVKSGFDHDRGKRRPQMERLRTSKFRIRLLIIASFRSPVSSQYDIEPSEHSSFFATDLCPSIAIVPFTPISLKHTKRIQQLVHLLVPSLTSIVPFQPPLPTSATENSNLLIPRPLPPAHHTFSQTPASGEEKKRRIHNKHPKYNLGITATALDPVITTLAEDVQGYLRPIIKVSTNLLAFAPTLHQYYSSLLFYHPRGRFLKPDWRKSQSQVAIVVHGNPGAWHGTSATAHATTAACAKVGVWRMIGRSRWRLC